VAQQPGTTGTDWRTNAQLPAQIDETVLNTFLDQLDQHIDAKLDERIATLPQAQPKVKNDPSGGVAAILGVGIPFVVLAGVFGHQAGAVLAVLVIGGLAVLRLLRD